jgi:hypothetical protein
MFASVLPEAENICDQGSRRFSDPSPHLLSESPCTKENVHTLIADQNKPTHPRHGNKSAVRVGPFHFLKWPSSSKDHSELIAVS